MISELMVALRRNVRVSSKVEGAFRIDRPEYPETAVREAVANALMHRDYSPDGCASQVQVTMYDDRIEILSPGGLCRAMTVDRLGELGVSFPRNQALANILRATPYAEGFAEVGSVVENKGTGYFQIRSSLREANMPEPVAIDHITAFEVALYKAGAGAEAGRFGFGLGERGGGVAGAVVFDCLRALRVGRSCDPSRSGQTKQVASIPFMCWRRVRWSATSSTSWKRRPHR